MRWRASWCKLNRSFVSFTGAMRDSPKLLTPAGTPRHNQCYKWRLWRDVEAAPETSPEYETYVDNLRQRLQVAYSRAWDNSKKAQHRNKGRYDWRSRGLELSVGDQVLIKITGQAHPNKLGNLWADEPYRVVSKPKEAVPVYRVKPLSSGEQCGLNIKS